MSKLNSNTTSSSFLHQFFPTKLSTNLPLDRTMTTMNASISCNAPAVEDNPDLSPSPMNKVMLSNPTHPNFSPRPNRLDFKNARLWKLPHSSLELLQFQWIDNIIDHLQPFLNFSAMKMIHIVRAFCMCLIVISCVMLTKEGQDRDWETYLRAEDFHTQLQGVLFVSLIISIPMLIDVGLSFIPAQRHPLTKDREFGRWNVLLDVVLPNLCVYVGWIPLEVLDLLLFYQYIHILLIVIHRISTISSLLHLPNTFASSFKQIYVCIMVLCFVAFLYHFSLHKEGMLGSEVMWKALFTSSLMVALALITYRLATYFRMASISQAKAQYAIAYGVLLTHSGSQLVLGFLQLLLYPLDVIFFSRNPTSILVIECYFIVLLVVISAVKNFEIRHNELKHMQQLEFNRKMTRSISHEIRTPLNTAFMGLDLLMSSLEHEEEEEEEDDDEDKFRDLEKGIPFVSRTASSDKNYVEKQELSAFENKLKSFS